jgi:hypothetical protein
MFARPKSQSSRSKVGSVSKIPKPSASSSRKPLRRRGRPASGAQPALQAVGLSFDSPESRWYASRSSAWAGDRRDAPEGQDRSENRDFADDIDTTQLNEIIVSIDMKENGSLGCAYFTTAEDRLYLLEDIALADVGTIEMLIIHIQPTTVLVPSRAPDVLMEFLEKHTQQRSHGMICFDLR